MLECSTPGAAWCAIGVLALAAFGTRPCSAQLRWTERMTILPGNDNAAAIHDPARGRIVFVDGWAHTSCDVWERSAGAWLARDWVPGSKPERRRGFGLAHDSVRGRTVLFGGSSSSILDDTWEWDGREWQQKAGGPQALTGHALVYDAARQRVLCFGGFTGNGPPSNATWLWDGSQWTVLNPPLSPPPRVDHALAYDAARQRVVLFGGFNQGGFDDTWEWDGTTWTRRTPAHAPFYRTSHAMAYDPVRQRVVLFGGGNNWNDTWEWDGSDWAHRATSRAPPPQIGLSMTFDPETRRVLLIGGISVDSRTRESWQWDGTEWSRLDLGVPNYRESCAMAWDSVSRSLIMFGGKTTPDATWSWNGEAWAGLAPPVSPPARKAHVMAGDRHRRRIVLFGGEDALSQVVRDTWEWNGSGWSQRAPASSPPARAGAACAYDESRRCVVLFGGRDAVTNPGRLGDTWSWDGIDWVPRNVQPAPAPRSEHAMAFDAHRARTVLFGGRGAAQTFGDTWEWDGTAWQQRASAGPSARSGHTLAYDAGRRRVVLHGGLESSDTWEWDGSSWALVTGVGPTRFNGCAAYDEERERVVLFGGFARSGGNVSWPTNTYVYGTRTAPSVTERGGGCAGAAGLPYLVPSGFPVLGRSRFTLDCLNGVPGSFVLVPIALRSADIPLPGGCRLQVDPGALLFAPWAPLNATGFATMPLPIPSQSILMGQSLHAQGGVADGTMPLGLAFTSGITLTIGG